MLTSYLYFGNVTAVMMRIADTQRPAAVMGPVRRDHATLTRYTKAHVMIRLFCGRYGLYLVFHRSFVTLLCTKRFF